jgi:hypothetical protein
MRRMQQAGCTRRGAHCRNTHTRTHAGVSLPRKLRRCRPAPQPPRGRPGCHSKPCLLFRIFPFSKKRRCEEEEREREREKRNFPFPCFFSVPKSSLRARACVRRWVVSALRGNAVHARGRARWGVRCNRKVGKGLGGKENQDRKNPKNRKTKSGAHIIEGAFG